ncbi:unnamed protein product [Discula destructiva]
MADDFQLFTSLRLDWSMESLRDIHPRNLGWNSEVASPIYMLTYHRDRMLRAAIHWGWTKAAKTIDGPEGLSRLHCFVLDSLKLKLGERWGPDCGPMRVKVLLAKDSELSLESSAVPQTKLANLFPYQLPAPDGCDDGRRSVVKQRLGPLGLDPPYDVYIDADFTSPSEFTHFKTTKREMYDQARQRVELKITDTTKEVLIVNNTDGSIMEGSLTTPYFWRNGGWVTPPVSESFDNGNGAGGQDGTTRRWALERKLATEGLVRAAELVDGEAVWLSNGVRGFVFGRIHRPSGSHS